MGLEPITSNSQNWRSTKLELLSDDLLGKRLELLTFPFSEERSSQLSYPCALLYRLATPKGGQLYPHPRPDPEGGPRGPVVWRFSAQLQKVGALWAGPEGPYIK